MKANIIKIILAVAVVGIIGFFVWKWIVVSDVNPQQVRPPENQFTKRLEQEIDSLDHIPTNTFCDKFYEEIQYRITDYYRQQFFGNSKSDNDRWQEILSKNLYSAYAPKFIEQSMYVFEQSDWQFSKLNFIRQKVKMLQQLPYIEPNSTVGNSLKNIQNILAKYFEIAGFIASCKNDSYPDDIAFEFPDMSDRIKKARRYLDNNLDNQYVNNCTRLKEGLRQIPSVLFNKHVAYLENKIKKYGSNYVNYDTQSEYVGKIYKPLQNQIYALDNDIYQIDKDTFYKEFNEVYEELAKFDEEATYYYDEKTYDKKTFNQRQK